MDRPNEKKLKVLFATPYKTGVGGGIAQWAENIMRHYQVQEAPGLQIEVLPMGRVANVKISSLVKRAVTGVVEYAAVRGIDIIPELDRCPVKDLAVVVDQVVHGTY